VQQLKECIERQLPVRRTRGDHRISTREEKRGKRGVPLEQGHQWGPRARAEGADTEGTTGAGGGETERQANG